MKGNLKKCSFSTPGCARSWPAPTRTATALSSSTRSSRWWSATSRRRHSLTRCGKLSGTLIEIWTDSSLRQSWRKLSAGWTSVWARSSFSGCWNAWTRTKMDKSVSKSLWWWCSQMRSAYSFQRKPIFLIETFFLIMLLLRLTLNYISERSLMISRLMLLATQRYNLLMIPK